MQSSLGRYRMLAKRWAWLVALGIIICAGVTYAADQFITPTYQASATLVLSVCTTQSTAFDCTSAGLAAVPTYAQLITSPSVLNQVVANHKGLTLEELNSMISVKPQSNTQLIEIDVENSDPALAMQLANEVSQSFAEFTNNQFPGRVQIVPAQLPAGPIRPRPLLDTGIGALVGLGLALALIVIFEWIDDRLTNSEEVQELLGTDTLAVFPSLSRKQRSKKVEKIPALVEGYRTLCASLNAAQTTKPFKLVMVTSALVNEGKSTIAANLASFLAMTGKQVLLVDANSHHPVLDQRFQLEDHEGLSSAWTELKVELDGQETSIPTLRVLTAGSNHSNSAELLQSSLASQLFDHFKKQPFDYVIFDTSPLLPVADTQILASYVQATVLVINASKTPRKVLLRAKQVLNRTHATMIGVVLNKSPWSDYGDIRHYLSGSRQPQAKFDLTESHAHPVDASSITTIPTTPRTNGTVEDPDMTIAISHQDKE